jgi:arylsulfatase A-like enzyme
VVVAGIALNRVPAPGGASAGPPVILLLLDTVRADHLSLQGYPRPTTPHLEELAREARVFTRATSAGDMTLSTHGSLFTGKYAREHGARHGGTSVLPDRFDTLAELLRGRGYRSYAVVANHGYLAPFFRLDQGFDYWDSRAAAGWTSERYLLRSGVRELIRPTSRSPHEGDRPFRSADDVHREVDALIRRLGDRLDGAFLFVNYMDAHFPYLPPPPYDTMFPGLDPTVTVRGMHDRRRAIALKGGELSMNESAHLLSQYDGAIAYLDSRLALLMERLRDIGAYDDAIVVITSDHGEAFGERGLIDHGVSVYRDQVFVPLLVKAPGAAPGPDDRPASSVDVLPTVLEAVGLGAPEGARGRSLLREAEPGRTVIAEHYPSELFVKGGASWGIVQRALTDGRHKLVLDAGGGTELYDVEHDPAETEDLAGRRPETVAELAMRLSAWLAATEEAAGEEAVLDDDAGERLEALGYVQ